MTRRGNRLFEQVDGTVTTWTHDRLNRPVTQQAGGFLRVAGTVNEPATVPVGGRPASLDSNGLFVGGVQVAAGTSRITVTATDSRGFTAHQWHDGLNVWLTHVSRLRSRAWPLDFPGSARHPRIAEQKRLRRECPIRSFDPVGLQAPGTYFPSLLQPRRRAEHALLAVVQEAWVHGISTRKVDDLVKALGIDGISKSEVSRICGELDATITAFRTRPLTSEHRYLWVDATYHKVRVDGRVTSHATVVAVGITSEGERQVLGVDVGPSEDRSFWTAFLRSLVKRGLKGVRLVISDAHEGLKQAIGTVLSGTAWQRCRVHFMRNLLATVPHGAREAVAAIVRTIFAQPDHASALQQLKKIADGLRSRFAKAAALLDEAAEDILAYRHVPLEHQRQLHSTNPLERLNKEIKRRSNVVGIFPNPAAVLRLVGAVLLEQDDEWAVAERRYFSAESMKQLNTPELAATTQEILATIM